MAITPVQQTRLLQMTQAMFGASPGATYLAYFASQMEAGNSIASLAQSLSGLSVFFGKSYSASLTPTNFANTFLNDLVGNRASAADKAWATTYITNKMAAGATQASIIADLTQALSSVPPSNANWGAAATYYNTSVVTKIVDNLAGSSATADTKTGAVNYILSQMAAGQNLGQMVEWAITALDGVDHANTTWGSAATLFDNRIEVSKYFSVDKANKATDLATLQQALKSVTADASSVTSAKAIFDTSLTGKIQDGYVAGATVTVHIEGQPDYVTTTDAKGNFTLPPGVFGTITAKGGTDISTGKPFAGELKAPAGSTTINPLTTLQQGFIDKGQTPAEAQSAVAKALGLNANVDITTFDPLGTALDPKASAEERSLAAKFQSEAAKVANFLVAASKTLQGAAGGSDKLDTATAENALLNALVNAIASDSDGVISFSDKNMLSNIMKDSVALSGDSDLISADNKVSGLADNFASMSASSADSVDKAFNAGGDVTEMIKAMAQAQAVAQGSMADQMLAAAENGSFDSIVSSFTGSAFDDAASSATIGTLDPDTTNTDTTNTDTGNTDTGNTDTGGTGTGGTGTGGTSTGNGTRSAPSSTETANDDVLNATLGSVGGTTISYHAANGSDQYVIQLGAGNAITSTANVSISGFSSNDKLVFAAVNGTTLTDLESIYSVSDNGTDISLITNGVGTVQHITLTNPTGSIARTGNYISIDNLTELNTFLGGNALVVDTSIGNNSAVTGNGTLASPSTIQTSGNDVLNATLGSVTGTAIAYDALYGNDQYVISLGANNTIISGANVNISHFASGDKLVFDAANGSTLASLSSIYSISDNGSNISLIANSAGTVQQITLIGLTGSRAAVGGSIDTLTELNTFLGGSAIDIV